MRYFREHGKSDHEVIETLNTKFGDNYQIMTRKTVKLGGILGVGRRTGVEYFGYIKEKAGSGAGNRLGRNSTNPRSRSEQHDEHRLFAEAGTGSRSSGTHSGNSAYHNRGGEVDEAPQSRKNIGQKQAGREKESFPANEKEQSERDQRNREEILERFTKNKEVQRLLREKKIVLGQDEHSERLAEEPAKSGAILPPAPYFDNTMPGFPVQQPYGGSPAGARPVSTQQNSGFTPIYDPAAAQNLQPVANPQEYASVNYDILTTPASTQNRLHSQTGSAPQNPYESRYDSRNSGNFEQNNPHLESQARSQLGQTANPNYRGQPNYAPQPQSMPWNNEHSIADQAHAQRFPDFQRNQNQPDQQFRGYASQNFSGQRPQAFNTYGTQGYSSDPNSSYQRNIDQVETTFLRRLENLERKLDRRGSLSEPSSLSQLRESMYHNEFPPMFVDRLVSQMRRELPLEELEKLEVLWEYVLLHIAENLRFIDVQQQGQARVMVLVGPTGVGKTTTIAKLAARQCVEAIGGSKKVHLITLDNYRIGAQDQIRTYGEILGARVDCVETTEGLASCIAQDQESDIILIDTMGRSPGDHVKLSELRRFLEHSGNREIHLTVSATSGASALKEIITQFKPFGFRSVILTKLDELGRIGGTLATFLQEDIPLSYVTTGQKVPQDIRQASALVLFQQLSDVQVNWQSFAQKLEENIF